MKSGVFLESESANEVRRAAGMARRGRVLRVVSSRYQTGKTQEGGEWTEKSFNAPIVRGPKVLKQNNKVPSSTEDWGAQPHVDFYFRFLSCLCKLLCPLPAAINHSWPTGGYIPLFTQAKSNVNGRS